MSGGILGLKSRRVKKSRVGGEGWKTKKSDGWRIGGANERKSEKWRNGWRSE